MFNAMNPITQEKTFRLFPGGIFGTPVRAWLAVGIYTIALYSTLTLAYDLYIRVFDQIGRDWMSWLLNLTYVLIGLVILLLLLSGRSSRPGAYVTLALVALATGYCLYLEDVPANRIHFLQYGPLTILVLDALRFHCRDSYIYVWTLALVTLIGLGDEVLQGVLSDRRFDPHDVVLNSLAGILTLALVGWVLGPENYPRGVHFREKERADG